MATVSNLTNVTYVDGLINGETPVVPKDRWLRYNRCVKRMVSPWLERIAQRVESV